MNDATIATTSTRFWRGVLGGRTAASVMCTAYAREVPYR